MLCISPFGTKLESCLFEFLSRPVFSIRWSCFGMALFIYFFHVCAYSWMLVCLICFPGLCSIPVLAGFGAHCPALLPHGVQDSSVLHDAEQLVGGGHVVRDRPLAIPEKGVRRPDLADHQVVEPQDLDGALKFQPFVNPCLTEEHIHGVLLDKV